VSLGNVLAVQLIPGNDLLPTSSIRARPVFLWLLGSQSPPVQQLAFPTRNRANTGAPGKKKSQPIRVGISNYGGGV